MSALRSAARWHREVHDGTGTPKKSLFAASDDLRLRTICACVQVAIPAITTSGTWGREMVLTVRKRAIGRKVDGNVGKSTENVGSSTKTPAGRAASRAHRKASGARCGNCFHRQVGSGTRKTKQLADRRDRRPKRPRDVKCNRG